MREELKTLQRSQKARKSRILWLVDFLNAQMETLNDEEMLTTSNVLNEFIFDPTGEAKALYGENLEGSGFDKLDAEKFSENQDFFSDQLPKAQNLLRGCLDELFKMNKTPYSSWDYKVLYYASVFRGRVVHRPIPTIANIDPESERPTFENVLKHSLLRCLSNYPLATIGRCKKPGCGRYIFRVYRSRIIDYCRGYHSQWARTTRWRKRNKEVYNTYQRNLKKGVTQKLSDIRKELKKEARKGRTKRKARAKEE